MNMKRLAAVSAALCMLLAGCKSGGEAPVPLTEEEIAQANETFIPLTENPSENYTVTHLNGINCFFTSYYSAPEEIDLSEFLRCFPLKTALTDEDTAEWETLKSKYPQYTYEKPSDSPHPIYRCQTADITNLLKRYANITAEDLQSRGDVVYLEEYDSFYDFTSDFAAGVFACTGGEKAGNTVRMWSDVRDSENSRAVLTVYGEDGSYFIKSFQNVPEE